MATTTSCLQQAGREIDAAVSGNKTLSSSHLFVAILRMRMFCNLGKVRGLRESTPSLCSSCSIEDDSTTVLDATSVCLDCGRSLLFPKPGNRSDSGSGRGTPSELRAVDSPSRTPAISTGTTPSNIVSTKLSTVVRHILDTTSDVKQ